MKEEETKYQDTTFPCFLLLFFQGDKYALTIHISRLNGNVKCTIKTLLKKKQKIKANKKIKHWSQVEKKLK